MLHWLSWILPLLAVLLPILGFVVAASIPVDTLRWGEARTALGRGDFLIPVLLVCIDAVWRWCVDVKCGWRMGVLGVISCALCVAVGVVCLYSFSVASSLPVTTASTDSVTLITLTALVVGAIAGMIAVAVSAPNEPEPTSATEAAEPGATSTGSVPASTTDEAGSASPSKDGE